MRNAMKRIISICISLLCLGAVCAENHDMIITTDREQIQCVVKEISEDVISYLRPDRPATVSYTIARNKVVLIQFSNGSIELFQEQKKTETFKEEQVLAVQKEDSVKEQVTLITSSNPTSTASEEVSSTQGLRERIFRDGNEYMHNNTYISAKQVGIILKNKDGDAYAQWKKANNLALSGCIIAGIGIGSVLGGLCTITSSIEASLGLAAAGVVLSGVGVTLMLCAPIHYEKALNIYNEKYDKYTTLSFSASPQSLALRVCF